MDAALLQLPAVNQNMREEEGHAEKAKNEEDDLGLGQVVLVLRRSVRRFRKDRIAVHAVAHLAREGNEGRDGHPLVPEDALEGIVVLRDPALQADLRARRGSRDGVALVSPVRYPVGPRVWHETAGEIVRAIVSRALLHICWRALDVRTGAFHPVARRALPDGQGRV